MRLDVMKTYKLYIGGAFPRSESGRSYELKNKKGNFSKCFTGYWINVLNYNGFFRAIS